ncbi:hypothetical protein AB4501_25915, partial [Vibrio sp. 10N.222.55.E8]
NMLLNLPPFVSYIFTATEVPKPSLISPIKVSKSTLENFEEIRQKKLEKSKPSPKKEPIKHDHIEEIRQKIRSTQEDNPNVSETQADSSNMADNENRASEEAYNNSGLVPQRTEESNTQPYPSSIPENEAPASDENHNNGGLTPQHK